MQSIEDILKRNIKVEANKAWETSYTRRFVIMSITYLTAVTFLKLINNDAPLINGLVPVGGYFLSTLSLPTIKKMWLEKFNSK
jgi:hypothetical protein